MPTEKEWTVMFYFASDNPLAAILVSQLKAIKDAGFQENTDVVVYFDPNESGTPTCLYHVNSSRRDKARLKTRIGDDDDSYVRNIEDDEVKFNGQSGRAVKAMMKSLENGDNVSVRDSLEAFLNYTVEAHPARHYLLFLVGHGSIVGNDSFLPDEQPVSSIKLLELDKVIRDFTAKVPERFELLALHSCSMSAVEVAYQLRGTARYMMASEGLAFVGSWPYRQLLKRLFRAVEKGEADTREEVDALIERLYYLTYYNARDFRGAGYPLDLALCSLERGRYSGLTTALSELIANLRSELGQKDGKMKDLIQLAHLEAQSYYDENYTDLYDFCLCLSRNIERFGLGGNLKQSADDVCVALESDRQDPLVIHSKHFGWRCQYSHGLSIYFPWSEPFQKPEKKVDGQPRSKSLFLKDYQGYAFTNEFGDNAWINFLQEYFTLTMRTSRTDEDRKYAKKIDTNEFLIDLGGLAPNGNAFNLPIGGLEKPTGGYEKPTGGSGPSCMCPSIKNYPKIVVELPTAQQPV